jgi:hypothetical protein
MVCAKSLHVLLTHDQYISGVALRMKMGKSLQVNLFGRFLILAMTWLLQFGQSTEAEETFEQLQIGAQTYKNVTVTTKSKDYIFVLFSGGMRSLRVSELPEEAREKLGYVDTTPKPRTNSPVVWAKQTFSKLQTDQVKGVEEKVATVWQEKVASNASKLPPITTKLIAMVTAGLLVVYFFFCYCCMLICQKAGTNPSFLIFVPLLQAFPLLSAAQMSKWWFLAFLAPGVNLVPQIVWSIKIVQARRKGGWLAFWLVFPLTSFLAFLYLAFSDGVAEPKKAVRPVQIMTLETA